MHPAKIEHREPDELEGLEVHDFEDDEDPDDRAVRLAVEKQQREADAEEARFMLRDTFAQAALTELLPIFMATAETREVWAGYDDLADSCYNVAEAMLRRRDGVEIEIVEGPEPGDPEETQP